MKKITLIMPAKNASRYLEKTLVSVAQQTVKNQVLIRMILGESADDTRPKFERLCRKLSLDYIIAEEKEDLYISVYNAFYSVQTDYFAIMCFSDAYTSTTYLEEAINSLDTNLDASYVHADILTLYGNGSLSNGLAVRESVRSESGSRFTANVCLINDGINELTLVGRSSSAKSLLRIAMHNSNLYINPYGALFTMYLLFGCTGIFIPRFSVLGRHHSDSRNNDKALSEHDAQWLKVYNPVRQLTLHNIVNGTYVWRDGLLETIKGSKSRIYMDACREQINYIQSLFASNH